jgi:vancomycin permeability regulator SanA
LSINRRLKCDDLSPQKCPLSQEIIVDNYGDNTVATVQNSLSFIGSGERVIVVSSYYHITRIVYLYDHMADIDVTHLSAKAIRPRDIYGILREVVALIVYKSIGLV